MTNREIAEKLRYVAEYNLSNTHLTDLADELDPPRPEPGTVVRWRPGRLTHTPRPEPRTVVWWRFWWRCYDPVPSRGWELGVVGVSRKGVWTSYGHVEWNRVEHKPARFLKSRQVAVHKETILYAIEALHQPVSIGVAEELQASLDRDKEENRD